MQLRRYISLAWRWLWLIALGVVLAAGVAYLSSSRMLPVYQASTLLLISPSKAVVMDATALPNSDRLAATYAEMLKRWPVLDEVIARLGLPITSDALAAAISVRPVASTQLIQLSVEDTNPERAALTANEIPKVFIQQNTELQTRRFADSKASLQRQIESTQADIAQLQDRIRSLSAAANPDQNELDRLRRDLQTLQNSYTSQTTSFEGIRLEEAKQLDTLLVTEEARPPSRPIRPKTAQDTLLAALVGALLALGIVYLVEYLDDVLKDPDAVKTALGLATLGAVPAVEGTSAEPELVAFAAGHSAFREAYRVLRTNLQFAAVGRPLHLLLVTSPSPSEGKSVTSANLSITLAQSGRRVILVDCDLYRPRQHKLLQLHNNVGLTTALLDQQADLMTLLQESAVPGLRVLTSGPLPPNPAEILGSTRMREVLAALAEQADILVLDSPPVLAVADSAILASEMDGVLLVLNAEKTRRELAQRSMASLRQVQARVVGVVLNRVSSRRAGYYYYYYHSHDYSTDDKANHRRRRWPWQKLAARRLASDAQTATPRE